MALLPFILWWAGPGLLALAVTRLRFRPWLAALFAGGVGLVTNTILYTVLYVAALFFTPTQGPEHLGPLRSTLSLCAALSAAVALLLGMWFGALLGRSGSTTGPSATEARAAAHD